jgi:catechol 2,3-dioxygenase-like lactoylglutathione lyase family enzyme
MAATAPTQKGIAFGGVTPVLRVRDLSVSTDYYVRVLGFKVDFQTPGFVSVSRGRCCLFLCEGDQGNPGSWVWIDAKDVEAVHEEYRGSGAKIRNPPTNYLWALEMQVEDPDGNVLRLGSDPRHDEPTGDWLDMRGNRWSATSEGGWVKKERD